MLKPAQMYKEELNRKMLETWYNPEYMYWHAGTGEYLVDLPDNNKDFHHFVSVDKNDNVLGYITYKADWQVMSAEWWGIVSFDKGNITFVKDVFKVIRNAFEQFGFQRVEFSCYEDNPICSAYRKFVERCGGRQAGYYMRTSKLMDGKLHNSVYFEILAENYRDNKESIKWFK